MAVVFRDIHRDGPTRDRAQEDGGVAATMRLTGSLVITAGTGLRRGFRVEAVGFEDGHGTGLGRAVWTDDRGDRIFSRMVGAPSETGRRSAATSRAAPGSTPA